MKGKDRSNKNNNESAVIKGFGGNIKQANGST